MELKFEFSGMKESAANVRALAQAFERENAVVIREVLVDAQEKARARVPLKRGTLKRSIEPSRVQTSGTTATGTVGSDLPYARITELGGTIKPKGKGFLAWYDPKNPIAAKSGKYKGWVFTKKAVYHPAQPYLFPTLVQNITLWLKKYTEMYDRVVSEIGRK